ncbi:MutS-related protein [Telluribacter sp. SYSU D00476]|uniref:MutS-related protein n=1 Tax=Telluribacter sp. SYSU D00476 TaxID=2811430 RepID=UPI001FF3895E|nr:DNA mismatch repair protein MutS [Telluribacter sp. SYSU D00476]
MTSPRTFFETQLQEAREAEAKAQRQFNSLAIGRLTAFVVGVASAWAWNRSGDSIWGGVTLIALVIFLVLMRRQQAARIQRDFQRNLQRINEDELDRLSFKFKREDTGEQYQERDHPYATDLDIFGKHSLYRLLNRTRTAEGSRRLAQWLTQHAPLEEVTSRQVAAAEFRKEAEWRQQWEATALLHEHAAQHVGELRTWVNEPLAAPLQQSLRWRWWPAVTLTLGVLALTGVLPGWPFWPSLIAHGFILKRFNDQLQSLTNRTTSLGHTLLAYADLLHLAETAPYQSPWWAERQSAIKEASTSLRSLGGWFARLDYRHHPFFVLLVGLPFLWDLHCLAAIERWKQQYGTQLHAWLEALADAEALNSLAGFAFANPDYTEPHLLAETTVHIEADTMGHPLIPADKRVSNDFSLKGTGQTMLITGSNMSGKSTFLRTVGLNLVLAQLGAVVSAQRFVCTPVQVFSSMRTQDSLEESTSSFYAELKRLRQLLVLAEDAQVPVLYLLDEILKGTNSADRHRGAEALIRQLHPKQSAGLVSTHDLELGQWGATQTYVHNFHFRSDVQDGQLTFDYKLHGGICQSFNASELMRMMGIRVDL